jgi:hypothetical protein
MSSFVSLHRLASDAYLAPCGISTAPVSLSICTSLVISTAGRPWQLCKILSQRPSADEMRHLHAEDSWHGEAMRLRPTGCVHLLLARVLQQLHNLTWVLGLICRRTWLHDRQASQQGKDTEEGRVGARARRRNEVNAFVTRARSSRIKICPSRPILPLPRPFTPTLITYNGPEVQGCRHLSRRVRPQRDRDCRG